MSDARLSLVLIPLLALAGCGGVAQRGAMMADRLTGGAPAPAADAALADSCPADPAAAGALAQMVNEARAAEGRRILGPDKRLVRIAKSHACDMARSGRVDVAGSNGSNVVDRARAADYPTCGVTQLVARGGTPAGIMAQWLQPGPYRDQVLGQLNAEIGSGTARGADGQLYYSVVMGNDC